MPTVDEKAGEMEANVERTGNASEDTSALRALLTSAGVSSENLTHQTDAALKRARMRLDACRYGLAHLEASGAQIDDALGNLIAKIKAFEALVDNLVEAQEDSDLTLTALTTENWAAVLHERLLTQAGGFSTYLQGAENTPSNGGQRLASWVPSYDTLLGE